MLELDLDRFGLVSRIAVLLSRSSSFRVGHECMHTSLIVYYNARSATDFWPEPLQVFRLVNGSPVGTVSLIHFNHMQPSAFSSPHKTTAADITEAALRSFENTPDARSKELLVAAVKHLHPFAVEVKLTTSAHIHIKFSADRSPSVVTER